ncbi:MAG: hypothetical protein ACJAZF_003597 [Granulosicoccus sp.]|jgi:hypothetical protein
MQHLLENTDSTVETISCILLQIELLKFSVADEAFCLWKGGKVPFADYLLFEFTSLDSSYSQWSSKFSWHFQSRPSYYPGLEVKR